MDLQALYGRIIVRPNKQEETTPGGVFVPEAFRETVPNGKVIKTGTGYNVNGTTQPLMIQEGDTVFYHEMAGARIKYLGEELLVLQESDVLCFTRTTVN